MAKIRFVAIALAAATGVLGAAAFAIAQPYGGFGMMHGYGSGIGIFGPILMVFSVAVIVVASVWFLRRYAPAGGHRMGCAGGSGLEILERRYARGDINRDEYLQKKADLAAKVG